MRIRVTKTTDALERDLRKIATTTQARLSNVVRSNTEQGNRFAASLARKTAGAHGVHYPKSFMAEMVAPLVGEYGPDASMRQGGMSFEFGSRNQPPHLDLAKSADKQGVEFGRDVAKVADRLFW